MRNIPTGFLNVTVNGKNQSDPISGAKVTITEHRDRNKIVKTLETNDAGQINHIELEAPNLTDGNTSIPYKKYDLIVDLPPINGSPGRSYVKSGIQIWNNIITNNEDELSYITALEKMQNERNMLEIDLPDNSLSQLEVEKEFPLNPYQIPDKTKPGYFIYPEYVDPFVPSDINVYLGAINPFKTPLPPANNRRIIQENYKKYLKIVSAKEFGGIVNDLTEQAIIAFVLCVNSYALNRIYTELYVSRGYSFNITNSTSLDQDYPPGFHTFERIDNIVEQYFNKYIRIKGKVQPLLTPYCRGDRGNCSNHGLPKIKYNNLSKRKPDWSYLDLLKDFFSKARVEIEVVEAQQVEGLPAGSYPGYPLKLGMQDAEGKNDIKAIQSFLNVVRGNFRAIPETQVTGIFDETTFKAVKKFQELFERNKRDKGTVDEATWYKISEKYVAKLKLVDPVIPHRSHYQQTYNQPYVEWVPVMIPAYVPVVRYPKGNRRKK